MKVLSKRHKLIIAVFIAALIICAASALFIIFRPKDMGAVYTESSETVNNPEKGFYELLYFSEGTAPKDITADLLVMRIGLGEFSSNYLVKASDNSEEITASDAAETAADNASDEGNPEYASDIPISEEFLASLSTQLELCRKNKTPVILRFSYDDFKGLADCEPSIEGIVSHIGQLKTVFEEYEDVICCLESGFLGAWGEQHSSEIVTQDNINKMLDALLDAVPESIPVSVRRPSYYAGYVGITESELKDYRAEQDSRYYRIGIYNDGYLGTDHDLGTFEDRDIFNEWMSYQGGHTLYGSEATVSNDPAYLDWTYVDGVCSEMFLTHTSYLNKHFNSDVFDRWKATTYSGDDPIYTGKTVYEYVENHLGYRYVLRKAEYTKLFNTAFVTLKIENVGAGNTVKNRNVSIIAVDEEGNIKEFPQDFDICSWESKTTVTEKAQLNLSGMSGKCRIYLKITDALGNVIQFANASNEFREDYGNFCGQVAF